MATVVTKKLSINSDNIKQYCEADNVSFDVGGHAWRKWLNGSTDGYVILKTEGKEVLYPTGTAHPFKADSLISASRSAGTCKVDLQFGGTKVHEESYTSGSQTSKQKSDITDSAVTSSTKATEIKWHVYGKNGDNQRGDKIELTLYFNQYAMAANVGTSANGIQSASVSNATPYQGDSVTFTPKLVSGATWHGWYSDESCATLVSTDQSYNISSGSDLTLYANATIDATTYNCAAVAKDWIVSTEVSDSIAPEGGICTFTAQASDGYIFGGWYSDSDCTILVSTDNPYTAIITADTTLYAKAHVSKLNISVGQTEHGTASVNASVINYGDNAVFTFTPESGDYELYGWYSDEGLTQLVSADNPYTCTPTSDYKLFPKSGPKQYTIKLTRGLKGIPLGQSGTWTLKIAALYYDELTYDEKQYIKTGEFDKIASSKVYGQATKTGVDQIAEIHASLQVPCNTICAIWCSLSSRPVTCFAETGDISIGERNMLNYWPYYMFKPTQDKEYFCYYSATACICTAIAKNGIQSVDATTPTFAGKNAIFSADIEEGHVFKGWYSDEACTKLVSSDNPASITTPSVDDSSSDPQDGDTTTSKLTLYALGEKEIYNISVGTSPYGTATVSASTAQHGDSVTFSCTPATNYRFVGWYSDEGLTQLVSSDEVFSYTVTGNVMLYPKIEIIKYKITLTAPRIVTNITQFTLTIFAYYKSKLSDQDVLNLHKGQFSELDLTKLEGKQSVTGRISAGDVTVSLDVPKGCTCFLHSTYSDSMVCISPTSSLLDETTTTNWPYHTFIPTEDQEYFAKFVGRICNCSGIAKDGIAYTDVTNPTAQGKEAVFRAKVQSGYSFSGWYSDEGCTTLVSSDNPANISTPTGSSTSETTALTLYAKATQIAASGNVLYFKSNGSYAKATKVYKKVSGAWVEQTDVASLFDGTASGSSTNYVYGGSV